MKLLTLSPEGKECIVAIHTAGDVFGELCLSGTTERLETATAMEETELRVVPCTQFFNLLRSDSLLEGFVRYLSVRIADQQEVITHLVTKGSEHRLGTTLLELARKLGKRERHGLTIEHKISQDELSHMVGTTRSRVSEFMHRFRELRLIETRTPHCLEKVMALTDNRGVDVAIEAIGISASFDTCQAIVAAGGHLANIGVHGKPVQLNLDKLWSHNITLTTRLVDTVTTPMLLKTVVSGKVRPKQLITHHFTLDAVMKAYDTFGNAMKERALKIIITND